MDALLKPMTDEGILRAEGTVAGPDELMRE
jgi:hypothetical protein